MVLGLGGIPPAGGDVARSRPALPGRRLDRVHADTLRRLQLRKAERGLPTFDAAVTELLGGAE
jgi:hypothetical protein